MSMNSCDQRFINKQTNTKPLSYQNYSKSKIIKNLARTLSLFSIFSENYYKSKTRNIVTELCYKWYTTQTNDKVLTKQSKNQHVQGKSIAWFSFSFECSLQDPLWLLYVHFKSSSSNWLQVRNAWYLYKISLVYFIMWTMLHSVGKAPFQVTQLFTMWPEFLSQSLFTTESHVTLHMIDFDCLQWPHDISRAYCLFLLEFLNSLPKIFLSFSVRTSFQQFLSAYTRLI